MSAPEEHRSDERGVPRMMRASWGYASRGARRHVENARAWVIAEGLEERIKERNARQISAHHERASKVRARRGARASVGEPPRALTPSDVRVRAFSARAFRSAAALAVPCALIAYPPASLIQGDPGAMILWPLTYGFLVWDGWMFSRKEAKEQSDEQAREPEQTAVPSSMSAQFVSEPANHRLMVVYTSDPTPRERAILDRLHRWQDYAAERKLQEVFPGPATIDESGLILPLTFAGQWTPAKLDAQLDQIRALLAVPDEVRTQIRPGGTADRALLRIRTRIRDLDLRWTPEREGLGLDADTGAVVDVDDTERLLVAGTSGSGKSVALRVLMAKALRRPHAALVILDLKKAEGALWRHTARVESEPDGIQEVVAELIEEMKEREDIMESQGVDLWEPTEERPNLTVAVDEGAELLAEVPDSVGGLRSLARRARAAGIRLWWATQKPTMTGAGPGLDSQISGQLTTQVCLAVAGAKEARVVLGEDATAKGWHAEDLELGGWALVHGGSSRKPDPMRVWFMTKDDVKALPSRKPWKRERRNLAQRASGNVLDVALRLSEGLNGVPTTKLMVHTGMSDTEVHAAMRVHGLAPEPNAFAMGDGTKARGYRREHLEAARRAREE